MSGFTFNNTNRTFDVKVVENGIEKIVKTYTLDIGNYDLLKTWTKKIEELGDISEKVEGDKPSIEVLDELKAALETVIPFILGEGSFNFIWNLAGGNLFACVSFVKYLGEFIQEQIKEIQKAYV